MYTRIKGKEYGMSGKHHSEKSNLKNRLAHFGKKLSEEQKKKIGLSNIGKHYYIHSEKAKLKMSKAKKGYVPWNKGKKGVYSEEVRRKMSVAHKQMHWGKNNPAWKGGVVPITKLIRHLTEYKIWIKNIFIRDNYTCQNCGIKNGNGYVVFLHSHHIKPFTNIFQEFLAQYSQFSPVEDKETLIRLAITYQPFWDINNGITLCKSCHLNKAKIIAFKKVSV